MTGLLTKLKKYRGTIGAILGAAGVGGATVVGPNLGSVIAMTHTHQNQVQIAETPLWVQEINRKIDEKYIMTCGAKE